MKTAKIVVQLFCAAALAALLPACTTTTSTTTMASTEAMLTKAGFTTHVAKTAKQKAHLQSMPAGRITKVKKNGKNIYVYPDPAHNQIYAGNQAQFNAFKSAKSAQARTSAAADMNGPDITLPTNSGIGVEVYEGWVPFDSI
jgi:ABC-type uncharacterized transport system auxiliary subunit